MVKANPPSYCAWCEEKLASKEQYPYCSRFCKQKHMEAP